MKKLLYIGLILFVGFGSLLQLSAYVHNDLDLEDHPYIKLVPPPPIVLGADYGTPLVTTDIGLFAYYEAADWDLNDVLPAFLNYTQYSNYVDGYVRVWIDVEGTTFVGTSQWSEHDPPNDKYGIIDVSVRVRSDGWILAWIEDSQEKAFICHWGDELYDDPSGSTVPTDYSTCLGRAIYRVYHNAGVSWIGYDAIYYYDYEFPDATRLSIFGYCSSYEATGFAHFYFIVPSGVTIENCALAGAGEPHASQAEIQLDSVTKIQSDGSNDFGWYSVDITGDLSNDVKHDVAVRKYGTAIWVCAVILWTS